MTFVFDVMRTPHNTAGLFQPRRIELAPHEVYRRNCTFIHDTHLISTAFGASISEIMSPKP